MTESGAIRRWAIPASFATVSLALFARGVIGGEAPVFRDLLVLVIPLRHAAREAIRSGSLPLWTNDLFFGAPFLANYQSAVFYPPSALIYALPFPAGLSLYLAFHFFIGGWGVARYLRRCGNLGAMEAAFGGLIFVAGGYFFSLVPLANQLAAAAWLPWALGAAEETLETGGRRAFLRLTIVLALQMLVGAPEPLLITIGLIVALVVTTLLRRSIPWRRCLAVGFACLLAASLSAAQLLPTLEYVLQSDRALGLGYDAAAAESVAPRSLWQLLLPHTFTNGAPDFIPEGRIPLFWSLYLGIVPLALATLSLLSRPFGSWSLVFWTSLALALGPHAFVFSTMHELAPRLVESFRFPGKFFLAAHFAASVLAARGLSEVVRKSATGRAAAVALAAIIASAVAVAVTGALAPFRLLQLLGYSLPSNLAASTYSLLASRADLLALRGAGVALLGLVLLRSFTRGRISAPTLLSSAIVLAGLDLVLVHQPTLVFADWDSLLRSGARQIAGMNRGERIFHYCLRATSCLPEGAPGIGAWSGGLRPGEPVAEHAAMLWGALVPDAPMVYGLGSVGGSDGLSTAPQRELFRRLALSPRERGLHLLASLGVSYLVGPEPLEPGSRLRSLSEGTADSLVWKYAVVDASPRTYLAEAVFAAPDWPAALDRLSQPGFRPGRDAVLIGEAPSSASYGPPGKIDEVHYDQRSIEARLRLTAPALWVVSDTWFPGWKGQVDGAPAELLRVNGICRGLLVPAGDHHAEMRYCPRSFAVGRWVSTIALVFLLVVVVESLRRGKRFSAGDDIIDLPRNP